MNTFKLRRFNDPRHPPVRALVRQIRHQRPPLEEMMAERGLVVGHTTIWRWIQHYAPLLEKEVRWYQGYTDANYVNQSGR